MPLDAMLSSSRQTPLMEPGTVSKLMFPIVERKLTWTTKGGQTMPFDTHKALVRAQHLSGEMTPRVLSVVNSTYKLVTNRELFTAIEDTMIKCVPSDKLAGVVLKDKIANYGKLCYREYVFPNITCDIGGRAPIGFRIVVCNGYGGSAVKVLAGAIDFFCTNGMVRGEYESTYARHSSGLLIGRFQPIIETALESFATEAKTWARWVETPVKYAQAMELFHVLAKTDNLTAKLCDQFTKEVDDRGLNLWSVYSAMTNYASHNEVSPIRKNVEVSGAATMFKRESEVLGWIKSKEFRELENV